MTLKGWMGKAIQGKTGGGVKEDGWSDLFFAIFYCTVSYSVAKMDIIQHRCSQSLYMI